jgi:glycosyltransferase involved in cell wall biosynthesis
MSRVAVVSFRLGGTDGVSIEAAKWVRALRELGHHVSTVAGSGIADQLITGLAADSSSVPSFAELNAALEPFDLVIIENLASLPLNVAARDVLYEALKGRVALFHHHDLPWQRTHLAHLKGPRDEPGWRHVTINELSRRELHERGIDATVIYNSFECSPPPGRRDVTRRALRLGEETLVALPSRAIPRKNVEGALTLCDELNAVLWIMGPAEDDYGEELERLLNASPVTVRRMLPDALTMADAYAGADLVVMPSTWEGFGNPVIESVTHRRALALNHYPVALEILSFGFTFFELSDVAGIKRFLDRPDERLLDANLEIARRHFNLDDLASRLDDLVGEMLTVSDD